MSVICCLLEKKKKNSNYNQKENKICISEQKITQLYFYSGNFQIKNQIEIYKAFEIIKQTRKKQMNIDQESIKYRNSISSTQASFGFGSHKTFDLNENNKDAKICRICLAEENPKQSGNEPLIRACRCLGSLMYVHNSCIFKWVNTIVQKKIELGQQYNQITCEICQDRFDLRMKKKLACRTKQEIKYRMRVYWLVLVLNIGFIIATLGVLGFLGWQQAQNNQEIKQQIIAGWAVLSGCLFFWIANLIRVFVLYSKSYVYEVRARKEAPAPKQSAESASDILRQLEHQPEIFVNQRPSRKMIHLEENKNQNGQHYDESLGTKNLNPEVSHKSQKSIL